MTYEHQVDQEHKVHDAQMETLTLILDPLSARYRAIIFILRPLIAAKIIGNIVGPCPNGELADQFSS